LLADRLVVDCVIIDVKLIKSERKLSNLNIHCSDSLRRGARKDKETLATESQACQDRRAESADFVPFVVTTDDCIADQGQRFLRRLGKRLAEKWGKAYSEVAGLLFSRMPIAIVLAGRMCIRATCN
jgi:hypothetical protein